MFQTEIEKAEEIDYLASYARFKRLMKKNTRIIRKKQRKKKVFN